MIWFWVYLDVHVGARITHMYLTHSMGAVFSVNNCCVSSAPGPRAPLAKPAVVQGSAMAGATRRCTLFVSSLSCLLSNSSFWTLLGRSQPASAGSSAEVKCESLVMMHTQGRNDQLATLQEASKLVRLSCFVYH